MDIAESSDRRGLDSRPGMSWRVLNAIRATRAESGGVEWSGLCSAKMTPPRN
jgi:hypothetical protein